jgi:hypothetical protein
LAAFITEIKISAIRVQLSVSFGTRLNFCLSHEYDEEIKLVKESPYRKPYRLYRQQKPDKLLNNFISFVCMLMLCTQVNMMFVMLLCMSVHSHRAFRES